MSEFDHFAKDYDAALNQGLSLSGESKDFFAEGRIRWMIRTLEGWRNDSPAKVMDFGCGTGTSAPLLKSMLSAGEVVGVDPSADSIRVASGLHPEPGVRFALPDDVPAEAQFDLVFCNGVFHHIPVADRPDALAWIRERLMPGGRFVLWENNPLNLGTQIVMSRIPFDRDAVKLVPWASRRLLMENGYNVLDTSYMFVFPSFLKALRGLEPFLSGIPLGAQYQVISEKACSD